jgi:ATP-dependent protease ClpP protease subunit
MFHPNVWTFTNEKLGVFQIEEKVNIMKKEHDLIASIISSSTGKTVEQVKTLMFDHQSFSAKEAQDFGLVHEIRDFQIPKETKIIVIDEQPKQPRPGFLPPGFPPGQVIHFPEG